MSITVSHVSPIWKHLLLYFRGSYRKSLSHFNYKTHARKTRSMSSCNPQSTIMYDKYLAGISHANAIMHLYHTMYVNLNIWTYSLLVILYPEVIHGEGWFNYVLHVIDQGSVSAGCQGFRTILYVPYLYPAIKTLQWICNCIYFISTFTLSVCENKLVHFLENRQYKCIKVYLID